MSTVIEARPPVQAGGEIEAEVNYLAKGDARTIAPDDLVPSDLVYRDKVGDTYSVVANSAHHWFYFPRLRADETLLLKIYDSLDDGRACLTARTASDASDDARDCCAAPEHRGARARVLAGGCVSVGGKRRWRRGE